MAVGTMRSMRFHEKLEKIREAKGWDQADIARKAGVSDATASNWFKGARTPKWQVVPALADALGVPIDYLMRDEIEEVPSGLTDAERQAIKMIRELRLDEGEVIRRLCGQAATSRPLTLDEIEVRPLTGPQSVPKRPAASEPRKPRKGA